MYPCWYWYIVKAARPQIPDGFRHQQARGLGCSFQIHSKSGWAWPLDVGVEPTLFSSNPSDSILPAWPWLSPVADPKVVTVWIEHGSTNLKPSCSFHEFRVQPPILGMASRGALFLRCRAGVWSEIIYQLLHSQHPLVCPTVVFLPEAQEFPALFIPFSQAQAESGRQCSLLLPFSTVWFIFSIFGRFWLFSQIFPGSQFPGI